MGQYHMIINVDKKEYLRSNAGLKLLEWGYLENPMNLTLLDNLTKNWKGDRVYVVGDYGNSHDVYSEECSRIFSGLEKEFELCDKDGKINNSIYSLAYDKFKEIPLKDNLKVDNYRYIYNHDIKQYIDLNHCVPADFNYDFFKYKNKIGYMAIAPLPLLLSLSNGLGGGDYYEKSYNHDLVGSWVNNTKSLEVRKDKLDNNYEELLPEFQEGKNYMSYKDTQKIKKILEEKYIDIIEEDSWIKKDFIESIVKGKNPLIESNKKCDMER